MTSEPPQISILDARLAEIDSRLRTIQDGLVVDEPALRDARPRAPLPPPIEVPEPGAPTAPAELVHELRRLSDAHERVLAAVRELLAADEGAARSPEPTALHAVRVAVGPLASTDALRAFEHALADVPGVRTVELRGYQGTDHAVVEVQLGPRP